MIHESIRLNQPNSQRTAHVSTYLIEHSDEIGISKRPVIVICPGGGYELVSDREGEILALQFNAMGYHAVVLHYSIAPVTYPTALMELASVVHLLYFNCDRWHIDTDKIIIQGSSAGGHLAASFCLNWAKQFLASLLRVETKDLKPAGLMLSYPVITSGKYAHEDSFRNLLGNNFESDKDSQSLENLVNEDTPKTFIWHTFTDDTVPVENSLLFVSALREHKIPTEFHMYPVGGHGLSLANKLSVNSEGGCIQPECSSWLELAHTWIEHL